ncbi:MAG TPA: long-chain-acyl-CoA synthetase [Hyphomicrobiales bacterium]|nr:long-chain-acyl-CoA synthetase [Hyphomicrobiales bacterium]
MLGLVDRVRRETAALTGLMRGLRLSSPVGKHPNRTFPDVIAELAAQHGPRPALLSDGERFTYAELDARANRYARWARAQGLAKGDAVALLMPNRPDYFALWLGVIRAGGAVALLNTNLAGAGLAHCIDIVRPKHVIVAAPLMAAFETVRSRLGSGPKVWADGDARTADARIDLVVAEMDGTPLGPGEKPALTIEDRALYIYTSGTTGLPKAANINHYRLMIATHGFAGVMNTKPSDRMYVALPMYHTVGGVIAVGAPLVGGGSVVIREKFSAREFWDDIVRWDCTLFQYVGELCRYLVNAPPSEAEKHHHVRLCCGNGLRPDIWPTFVERFRIPEIREFYAATEGNVALFNFDNTPGAVGRIPWWAERRFPVKVIRFDVETEQPVRGPDGRCIECAPDEVGELIGEVLNDPSKPANRFEGYADRAETERKILHDVFAPGDTWFRTGDLMRKDRRGYFFFIDRVGDTYRWKGENVATTQVAEMLTGVPGVKEANVYGVAVPGADGRAGMAALVVDPTFDWDTLYRRVNDELPAYARPLFVRLLPQMDLTGTFKPRKTELVRDGFDPIAVKDELRFDDAASGRFEPLTPALYARIAAQQVRL